MRDENRRQLYLRVVAPYCRRRRDEVLRPGRGRVSVLEDEEHEIGAVLDRRRDAREKAVVPEAAVADGGNGPLRADRAHARGADQGSPREKSAHGDAFDAKRQQPQVDTDLDGVAARGRIERSEDA